MSRDWSKSGKTLIQAVLILGCLSGCSSTVSKPPSPSTSAEHLYRVQPGDTLYAIAQRFQIDPQTIIERNALSRPEQLKIGMLLVLPSRYPPTEQRTLLAWPMKELDISSHFGDRNRRHKGIDLRAPRGTSIHAAAAGKVSFAGEKKRYGKVIILTHTNGLQTLYAHNDQNLAKEGQPVRQGEIIATVGKTGNATGYHLHFELLKAGVAVDPRGYLPKLH